MVVMVEEANVFLRENVYGLFALPRMEIVGDGLNMFDPFSGIGTMVFAAPENGQPEYFSTQKDPPKRVVLSNNKLSREKTH